MRGFYPYIQLYHTNKNPPERRAFASPQGRTTYLPSKELSLARVAGPRIPVPAVNPEGLRISEAYFSWNFTTAALVNEPKSVVSFPEEPGPEDETLVVES